VLACRNVYPFVNFVGPDNDDFDVSPLPDVISGEKTDQNTILIRKKFDLKGSLIGRRASQISNVAKDLDLLDSGGFFELGSAKQLLLDTLEKDLAFLERHQFMDYSLLVAIDENYQKNLERFHINTNGAVSSIVSSLKDDG
jgi:hypothetical protein